MVYLIIGGLMNDKDESEMLQVIHEDMKGMHELGIINDARMEEFDKMCLAQEPKTDYETTSAKTGHLSTVTA
jgi:DNA-binding transcriptional regulator YiaG